MKKKLALLLALVMVCATMLTACGGSNSKLVGTWELASGSSAGVEVSADQIAELAGDMSFEFKDNGTVKMLVAGEVQAEADWKEDGDKVTISDGSTDMELTLVDGKLTMDQMGVTLTFEKK